MQINLTIEIAGRSLDIRIDNEQEIKTAINVLRQSGKLPAGIVPDSFHSMINQNTVSTVKTFAEENIFDGDKLTAVE